MSHTFPWQLSAMKWRRIRKSSFRSTLAFCGSCWYFSFPSFPVPEQPKIQISSDYKNLFTSNSWSMRNSWCLYWHLPALQSPNEIIWVTTAFCYPTTAVALEWYSSVGKVTLESTWNTLRRCQRGTKPTRNSSFFNLISQPVLVGKILGQTVLFMNGVFTLFPAAAEFKT